MASSTLIGPNIPSQKQVEIVADLPTALPPSGPAGGDLAGIYPNPTLITQNGVTPAFYGSSNAVPQIQVDSKGRIIQISSSSIAILAAAVTDFFTQAETIRLDQFAAPTSDVSLNSHKLTGVLSGVSSTDAANVGQLSGNAGAGVGDVLATSQTTTSATYTDLATVNRPAVTITTKTSAIVLIGATAQNSVALAYSLMSFAVSGATTLAAADANCYSHQEPTSGTGAQQGMVLYVSGLTAGSNTFTAKYRVSGGTGTWSNRNIAVFPLAV